MSGKDLISPYLNRFVSINQQKANAQLELCCKDWKVPIHLHHDFGVIEEAAPRQVDDKPAYSNILMKNVRTSQLTRLQRRARSRAEKARDQTKTQKDIAENAKLEAEKATIEAEKATKEVSEARDAAEKATKEASEARTAAVEAKAKLLKVKKGG